jgi:glycosyltransferase involved in cell wall biosynthesis
MILLSIITPVFNNVHFISLAIENYLSQDCKNTELIVMDGGSTDGTKEVIESYASKNSSIRWVSEKDEGQSDAMNKGIQLAKGKYISFLNVDDYYSDGCLNEVCQLLAKNPSIRYLVGDCNVWDQFGKLIYVNRPSKLKKWHVFSGHHFSVNPSAYFYQKSLHDEVGFYPNDNHYNMDLEMILRFREVTQFHYFPRIWGNFRMLPNAKTFEDQYNNQLEERKQKLLNYYFDKQNHYLKLMILLYRIKRVNSLKYKYLFRKIRDKIYFELLKITKN